LSDESKVSLEFVSDDCKGLCKCVSDESKVSLEYVKDRGLTILYSSTIDLIIGSVINKHQ